jgi:sulfur carrier protein
MRIELNGTTVELAEGATVAAAVDAAGADPGRRGIAVALNGEIVPRGEWDTRALTDGDAVEVLQAVAGG